MLYLMHIVPYYGYYTKAKSTQIILKSTKKCFFFLKFTLLHNLELEINILLNWSRNYIKE